MQTFSQRYRNHIGLCPSHCTPFTLLYEQTCKLTAVHIWSHNGWTRWNTEDEDYRKDHVHTYDENKIVSIMVFGQRMRNQNISVIIQ